MDTLAALEYSRGTDYFSDRHTNWRGMGCNLALSITASANCICICSAGSAAVVSGSIYNKKTKTILLRNAICDSLRFMIPVVMTFAVVTISYSLSNKYSWKIVDFFSVIVIPVCTIAFVSLRYGCPQFQRTGLLQLICLFVILFVSIGSSVKTVFVIERKQARFQRRFYPLTRWGNEIKAGPNTQLLQSAELYETTGNLARGQDSFQWMTNLVLKSRLQPDQFHLFNITNRDTPKLQIVTRNHWRAWMDLEGGGDVFFDAGKDYYIFLLEDELPRFIEAVPKKLKVNVKVFREEGYPIVLVKNVTNTR